MFDQDKGGGGIFAYVNKGELAIYEKDPSNTEVKVRKGHRSVTGTITGWEYVASEYNGQPKEDWLVKLQGADGERVTVVIGVNTGYWAKAVKALANADLTKPVMIKPGIEEVDGKKYGNIFISQYDQAKDSWVACKWAFTKDNPKGMPPVEKIVFGGKTLTDGTKQTAWLKDYLDTIMKPIVMENKLSSVEAALFNNPTKDIKNDDVIDEADGLPF